MRNLEKFDAAAFGIHPKQANSMDPQQRLLLEVTMEAILDAGCYNFVMRAKIYNWECDSRVKFGNHTHQ